MSNVFITPTSQILSDAIDRSALRQSVYAANIANANVDGYRRLEVAFDAEVARADLTLANFGGQSMTADTSTRIVATNDAVKLDQEMASMAKNAMQYQVLLGAYEKTHSLLRLAIKDGRG